MTIPEKAAAYYNIITTSMSPAEILEKMVKIAEKAFDMAIDHLKSAALSVSSLADSSPSIPWKTDVVTYKELYKAVCGCFSGNLEEYIKDHIEKLPSEMDDRDKCISLIDNLLELYPEKGPMIVVGFLPPYYPHRCSLRKSSCDERLIRVLDEIIDEAKTKYNEQIKVKEYFSGMCDLSYFGFQGEPNELMALSENMPGWGDIYSICIEELLKLDIPILNLGPSGKDAHKYTERLELNYSLNIVPQMLRSLISKLTDSIF
ncbi:hypothetical protein SDC9_136422 [bioreactor metagenome]|uniref:Protein RocB n=1 Tax=bioreactor metagenome TaxID=1076179 RepID=A0A645DKG2_9ZZZZ